MQARRGGRGRRLEAKEKWGKLGDVEGEGGTPMILCLSAIFFIPLSIIMYRNTELGHKWL
jgi:hypothetical protein